MSRAEDSYRGPIGPRDRDPVDKVGRLRLRDSLILMLVSSVGIMVILEDFFLIGYNLYSSTIAGVVERSW